jgi:hypothetical protein
MLDRNPTSRCGSARETCNIKMAKQTREKKTAPSKRPDDKRSNAWPQKCVSNDGAAHPPMHNHNTSFPQICFSNNRCRKKKYKTRRESMTFHCFFVFYCNVGVASQSIDHTTKRQLQSAMRNIEQEQRQQTASAASVASSAPFGLTWQQ